MSGKYRVLLIVLTGVLYVLAHEFGHYAIAAEYNLDPSFVYGGGESNILGMAIGVSHKATSAAQSFFIVLGATMIPLALAVLLTGGALFKGHEGAALVAEVFIILIIINLIPIPGMVHLDANRIWDFLLA